MAWSASTPLSGATVNTALIAADDPPTGGITIGGNYLYLTTSTGVQQYTTGGTLVDTEWGVGLMTGNSAAIIFENGQILARADSEVLASTVAPTGTPIAEFPNADTDGSLPQYIAVSPQPEPSTRVLLVSGVLALFVGRMRRRKGQRGAGARGKSFHNPGAEDAIPGNRLRRRGLAGRGGCQFWPGPGGRRPAGQGRGRATGGAGFFARGGFARFRREAQPAQRRNRETVGQTLDIWRSWVVLDVRVPWRQFLTGTQIPSRRPRGNL